MTTKNKRFMTTGIKNYRLSNSTYQISFDTIEDAKSFIEKEKLQKKFTDF